MKIMNNRLFRSMLIVLYFFVCQGAIGQIFSIDGVNYKVISGTNTVAVTYKNYHNTGGDEYVGDIVIPRTVSYNGTTYDVKEIDDGAFYDCTNLKSVQLPDGLLTIGSYAFKSTAISSLSIPNSVTKIMQGAFSDCCSMTSITLSEALETIGDNAFMNCSSLVSIVIPHSATNIGWNIFSGCDKLRKITFYCPEINEFWVSGMESVEEVVLGEGVEKVNSNAFQKCTNLSSLTIGNSVQTIGSSAFSRCSKLTDLVLGEGVIYVNSWAFALCENLETVSIAKNAKFINLEAFNGCDKIRKVITDAEYVNECFNCSPMLKEVVFGEHVKTIGGAAFYECIGLSSLTMGENVEEIQQNAFKGCTGIKSVAFDNKIQEIEQNAFNGCTGITSLSIPSSMTWIASGAFENCNITTLKIEDGENELNMSFASYEKHPFEGCPIADLYIGRNLKGAFEGFTSLKKAIFGNTVTLVPTLCFYNCTNLETLQLGSNILSLGGSSLAACNNIKDITSLNPVPPIADFSNVVYNSAKLTVPQGSKSAYQQAAPWKYFKTIMELGESTSVTPIIADSFNKCHKVYTLKGIKGYGKQQQVIIKDNRKYVKNINTL